MKKVIMVSGGFDPPHIGHTRMFTEAAEWGEVVVAYVVAENPEAASPSILDALCLKHVARFKRPKDYRYLDSLPKNNYGKVLKTELRERDAKEPG